jgi:hypothetical protein
MTIQTKNWYLNTSTTISRSEENLSDLGYSIAIPWNDITTTGWYNYRTDINVPIKMYGTENKMVLKDDPEYFAPNDLIRSTAGIPNINVNDPIYAFDRANYTTTLF